MNPPLLYGRPYRLVGWADYTPKQRRILCESIDGPATRRWFIDEGALEDAAGGGCG